MVARSELMAGGIPARVAGQLGTSINLTMSAAGTTQATATGMNGAGFAVVTTVAANSGVRLDPASGSPDQTVFNAGANTLTVYPAVGNTINNNAVNTGIQIAVGKGAHFIGHSLRQIAILSA